MTDTLKSTIDAALAADAVLSVEMLDHLPLLVSYVDRDLNYGFVNKAYQQWFGVGRAELAGLHVSRVIGRKRYARVKLLIERALQGETVVFEDELPGPKGMMPAQLTYTPRKGPEGEVQGFFVLVENLAWKKDAEAAVAAALDGVADGYFVFDRNLRFTHFNAAAERLYGVSRDEVLGRHMEEVWSGSLASPQGDAVMRVMQTGVAERVDIQSIGRPGHTLIGDFMPMASGGVGVLIQNITERLQMERQRELLINELNHRVKNTLAIVQSMAAQTLRAGGVVSGVREALEGRLFALAAAHDVLTRSNWETVYLQDLVNTTLAPFRKDERVAVVGPDMRLQARSAVALSMALHELATNAAKYGALSNEEGRVNVSWSLIRTAEEARIRLLWAESGGPPVRAPSSRGFGSRMIEKALAQDLRGKVRIDFPETGVVCEILAEAPYADAPQ